jgi:hypothetical protein
MSPIPASYPLRLRSEAVQPTASGFASCVTEVAAGAFHNTGLYTLFLYRPL